MAISSRLKGPMLAFGALIAFLVPAPSSAQALLWSAHYGGTYKEEGSSGCPTADGGFAVIGSTYSFGQGDFDIYMLRVNSDGDTLWTRTFGSAKTDYGHDIRVTCDGGFVIVGSTTSTTSGKEDVYVVRIDAFGAPVWTRTYGGAADDEGWAIRQTSDSGFIVCGNTESFGAGYTDVYLLRLNQTGDTLWTRTFGGPGGDIGFAVRPTPDSSYIIVGSTGSFGEGYSSLYAVKTDLSGNLTWSKTFGGPRADFGYAVEITLDGGYIFAGNSWSFSDANSQTYLVKTDKNGSLEWENNFGGPYEDIGYAVCPTSDGGYLLAGTAESPALGGTDIYLVATDPLGVPLWSQTYGGARSDLCRSVLEDHQGVLLLIGSSYSFAVGSSDVYLAKVRSGNATPVEDDNADPLPADFALAQNYPNPFNGETIIQFSLPRRLAARLTVFNVLGQVVREWDLGSLASGTHVVRWDGLTSEGHEAASGIYLYRLQTPEFLETRKMALLK